MTTRLLYVEDNEQAIANMKRIASRLQYEYLSAETVQDGLSMLEHQPDIIVLDMGLPDGNAIDFLKAARPELPDVPMFVFAGYGDDEARQACIEAGCTDYLVKPVDVNLQLELFTRYGKGR